VALGRTVEAFNGAVGSYETRVLPGARKLEELGAGGKKTLEDTEPVDARPRPLMATTTPAVAPTGRGSIRQLPLRGPQAVRAEADEASPPLADASA
jgi:hypothetical protein